MGIKKSKLKTALLRVIFPFSAPFITPMVEKALIKNPKLNNLHMLPKYPAKKRKKELDGFTKEQVLHTIAVLERRLEKVPKVQKIYDSISSKYGDDLNWWLRKQKNLPKDDYGAQVASFLSRAGKAVVTLNYLYGVCEKKGWNEVKRRRGREVVVNF